nr:uncharacterized protein LOC131773419 [Pocillopora verrucosa]
MGHLVNMGSQEEMEKIIQLQYTQAGQSGRGHLTAGEQKQFKGRGLTKNRAVDCAATMDQADHQPKNRFKRPIEEDFVDNSSESDDESIRAEQEKVEKIILNLGKKPLSNIPAPTATITTGQMEKRLLNLEREVQQIKASLEHVKKELRTSNAVPAGTCSPNSTPSGSKPHENKTLTPTAVSKPEIWHNGINLLNVKAPPKEPQKCALHLLDKLFTKKELSEGILFQSKRSLKPPLDEARVSKMFDVLNAQYTAEKIQKYRQAIIDACNQKCRDVARKEAGSALKCTNDTDNSRQ